VLGTHAYRVTDWQPGPTSWREVQLGDGDEEAPRNAGSQLGALVGHWDQTLPIFQGEGVPAPGVGVDPSEDIIETFADAIADVGYPS